MAFDPATVTLGLQAFSSAGSILGGRSEARKARKLQEKQLNFAMEQYRRWSSIYGDVERNLGRYYKNLSPETYAAKGLEVFEKEKSSALTQVREELAKRGLATSGIAAGIEADTAFESASQRAKIRAEAPMRVAQEQQQFVQLGAQRDPTSSVQNVLDQQAGYGRELEQGSRRQIMQGAGNIVESVINFASQKRT